MGYGWWQHIALLLGLWGRVRARGRIRATGTARVRARVRARVGGGRWLSSVMGEKMMRVRSRSG